VSDSASDRRTPREPSPARPEDVEAGGERTPTPARALLEDAETGHPQPASASGPKESPVPSTTSDAEETTLEADGARWVVRVLGRSRTGSAAGTAPLLLLSFRREGSDDGELEGLAVGHSLATLGDDLLLTALRRGRRPPDPGRRKEIFPELGGRTRDRDG
jgi:hypothetical protein